MPEELIGRAADPLAAVLATIRADWTDFPVPGATVFTQPRGETLAGAATRLSTSAALTAVLPPRTILGYDVFVTVTAQQFDWDFGDGTSLDTPASDEGRMVEHTYKVGGTLRVTLRTVYTATFSIPSVNIDDETLPGNAEVLGPPTALVVREARSQLEAGAAN